MLRIFFSSVLFAALLMAVPAEAGKRGDHHHGHSYGKYGHPHSAHHKPDRKGKKDHGKKKDHDKKGKGKGKGKGSPAPAPSAPAPSAPSRPDVPAPDKGSYHSGECGSAWLDCQDAGKPFSERRWLFQ